MSTMVKRVAQALQQEMETALLDEPASSFALARAAIAAMREPTEEMIDAWIRAPGAIKVGLESHDRRRLRGEMSDCVSERMRWLVKQFELSGQHRDAHIRLGACEVRLKCI